MTRVSGHWTIGAKPSARTTFGLHNARWTARVAVCEDGSVNSWSLLWKLIPDSHVLRLNSCGMQWFNPRFEAWKHLVPVRDDQGYLNAQLAWYISHRRGYAAISKAENNLTLQVIDQINADLIRAGSLYGEAWL